MNRHAEPSLDESPIYCLVPPELAELREVLDRDSFGGAPVEVVVDRRRRERRGGAERRRRHTHLQTGIERRLSHHLEGRRFAERRLALVDLEERPPLPAEVRRHAQQLRFVKRVAPEAQNREVARLRALATEWRRQAGAERGDALATLLRARGEARDALAATLEARDPYTWEHSAAVVWLALSCAAEIGLDEEEQAEIHDVALLHDIGKLGIPDAILRKEGSLSDSEWQTMRRHPVIGAQLIGSVEALQHLGPAIRAEHERWDGKGYPDGLAGEEIPIASRIVFACDAYHAMVSDRPYRKALTPQAARAELARNLGSQFWSEAAGSLLSVLAHGEPRDRLLVAIPREAEDGRAESVGEAGGARGAALSEALEKLLDATQGAHYTPGVLIARARARASLRRGRSRDLQWQDAARRAALERLLDATRRRRGYPPEDFAARARAEKLLDPIGR